MPPSRIVAIDPGPTESAIVLYLVRDRVPAFHTKIANPDALAVLWDLGGTEVPQTVCVIEEMVSYGITAGRSMFQTCIWAGRFAQHWKTRTGREVEWLPRPTVKMRLCHSMRATDKDVREELIHRFGDPGTKKQPGITHGFAGDQWAALAIAVAWTEDLQP